MTPPRRPRPARAADELADALEEMSRATNPGINGEPDQPDDARGNTKAGPDIDAGADINATGIEAAVPGELACPVTAGQSPAADPIPRRRLTSDTTDDAAACEAALADQASRPVRPPIPGTATAKRLLRPPAPGFRAVKVVPSQAPKPTLHAGRPPSPPIPSQPPAANRAPMAPAKSPSMSATIPPATIPTVLSPASIAGPTFSSFDFAPLPAFDSERAAAPGVEHSRPLRPDRPQRPDHPDHSDHSHPEDSVASVPAEADAKAELLPDVAQPSADRPGDPSASLVDDQPAPGTAASSPGSPRLSDVTPSSPELQADSESDGPSLSGNRVAAPPEASSFVTNDEDQDVIPDLAAAMDVVGISPIRMPAVSAFPIGVGSRARSRQAILASLFVRRTLIPILLTLGVLLPGLGIAWFLLPEESPFKAVGSELPLAMLVIGPVFLVVAILNMLQVRAAMRGALRGR